MPGRSTTSPTTFRLQEAVCRVADPIVTSGFEVGETTLYPAARLDSDFRHIQDHPIADAYRAYQKMPYDEPLWDPTAALYAVRPEYGYFSLSPAVESRWTTRGSTMFTAEAAGTRRYLMVDDDSAPVS